MTEDVAKHGLTKLTPEYVAPSAFARRATWAFMAAMAVSGVWLKLPQLAGVVTTVALSLASIGLALASCYGFYLAGGALIAGQYPGPSALVPTKCKVARGWTAKLYAGITVTAAGLLAWFAAFVLRFET